MPCPTLLPRGQGLLHGTQHGLALVIPGCEVCAGGVEDTRHRPAASGKVFLQRLLQQSCDKVSKLLRPQASLTSCPKHLDSPALFLAPSHRAHKPSRSQPRCCWCYPVGDEKCPYHCLAEEGHYWHAVATRQH